MISVSYTGRMGNLMFQYSFARSIAEDTGMRLVAPAVPGFANTGHRPGKEITEPLRVFRGCKVDRNLCKDAKIHLRGSFEYYPMLEAYKDRIKENWMYRPIEPRTEKCRTYDSKTATFKDTDPTITDRDVLLNIRLGDFLEPKHKEMRFLDPEFFKRIINKMEFRRLFIASDDIMHPLLRAFDVYDPVYIFSKDMFETFNMRNYFNRIIISRSSYTWWLAYLSKADEIYLPVPEKGVWSIPWRKGADHDLWVPEGRYSYYLEKKDKLLSYKEIKEEK